MPKVRHMHIEKFSEQSEHNKQNSINILISNLHSTIFEISPSPYKQQQKIVIKKSEF